MRVLAELKTTFITHCTDELSLIEALQADNMTRDEARATGETYLICLQKGL